MGMTSTITSGLLQFSKTICPSHQSIHKKYTFQMLKILLVPLSKTTSLKIQGKLVFLRKSQSIILIKNK